MDAIRTVISRRGQQVGALRAGPSGAGPGPGVLLVHDAWGLDDDAGGLAGSIAGAGFTVLAPDLLAGRHAADADEAHALAAGIDAEDAALLLAAALDALLDDPGTRPGPVGVVGVGMGAPLAAFLATIRPEIGAAVLAGPVPDLPLEAWARADAAIVVLHDAAGEDEAVDGAAMPDADADANAREGASADPAVALDRARAAGRAVTVIDAAGDDLAATIVRVLAEHLGPG